MGDSALQLERISVYYNESSCESRGFGLSPPPPAPRPPAPAPGLSRLPFGHALTGPDPTLPGPRAGPGGGGSPGAVLALGEFAQEKVRAGWSWMPGHSLTPPGAGNPP